MIFPLPLPVLYSSQIRIGIPILKPLDSKYPHRISTRFRRAKIVARSWFSLASFHGGDASRGSTVIIEPSRMRGCNPLNNRED